MTKPEPVLDAPRRAVAGTQPAVVVRTPTPSGFDPKDRFFPQALLEQFDEAPATPTAAEGPRTAGRSHALWVALLALIAVGIAAWWGTRSIHRAPPVVQGAPAPAVVGRPVAAIVPVAPAPPSAASTTAPASSASTTAHAAATPSSPPSAVVPAVTPIRTAATPVTHTRAAHAAPAAPAAPVKEESRPAPAAPPADCAPSIAALGLCGSANPRKGS